MSEKKEKEKTSGFTPASEMVPADFREFERRDEKQIIAEIQGQIIDEMFYQFKVKGRAKPVTGISWVGTKEIARRYGDIETELVRLEDRGDQYLAVVRATDKRKGVSLVGTSWQPKKMRLRTGELRDDKFAVQKVVSKAQRNAIRAVIPEEFLKKAYQAWRNKGKPPIKRQPPSSEPKDVDAEITVKEPGKGKKKEKEERKEKEENQEVRLSEEVIRYNIKAVAKDKAKDMKIWEREDEYIVQPDEELDEKTRENIDAMLKTLGAKWVTGGFNPHWEIPKLEA